MAVHRKGSGAERAISTLDDVDTVEEFNNLRGAYIGRFVRIELDIDCILQTRFMPQGRDEFKVDILGPLPFPAKLKALRRIMDQMGNHHPNLYGQLLRILERRNVLAHAQYSELLTAVGPLEGLVGQMVRTPRGRLPLEFPVGDGEFTTNVVGEDLGALRAEIEALKDVVLELMQVHAELGALWNEHPPTIDWIASASDDPEPE